MRSAIGWIKEKLQLHTPVFNNHGTPGDNSHEGRVPIGEIVGSKEVNTGDRAATIAAMYILPQYRNLKLDVASIEAEITYAREGNTVWPTGITQITGIALADGDYSQPGFPEATLIGSIAAFAKGDSIMDITEVKSAINKLELKPEDIFAPETLTGSDSVRDYIIEKTRDAQAHSRRVSDERDKVKGELEEKYVGEIAILKAKNLSFETATNFNSISDERKLDEKEKSYVGRQLKHFSSDSVESEKFKEDLNKFVDETLEDFGVLKPVFGMELNKEGETEGEDDTLQSSSTVFEDEMLNPDVNPLISDGKADLEYGKKT